jgi:hypothetical protein
MFKKREKKQTFTISELTEAAPQQEEPEITPLAAKRQKVCQNSTAA